MSVRVLLVEDNLDDVFLMKRALKKAELPCELVVVSDGQEALQSLDAAGDASGAASSPLPNLVFVDLKLPFLDGFDILESRFDQARLREIPFVILTSSPEDRDRARALALAATDYLVKPPAPETLRQLFARLGLLAAPTPATVAASPRRSLL